MEKDRKEVVGWLLSKVKKVPSLENLLEETYNRNDPYYKTLMYILKLEKKLGDK